MIMTLAELKKYCEENHVSDDTDIIEALECRKAVDVEYDIDCEALYLIFD